MMKAISILQPWASLIVLGAKKVETRSWNTKFKGRILIHASKRMTDEQKKIAKSSAFWCELKHLNELPLGAIIGSVSIEEKFKTENADAFFYESDIYYPKIAAAAEFERLWEEAVKKEKTFGDYSDGRYGWELVEPHIFPKHININGTQGLWNFPLRICEMCGCSENDACISNEFGPCWWVGENLCSHCAEGVDGITRSKQVLHM